MKKLLLFGGVIVVLFIAIIFMTNKADETKLKDNPYGKDDLQKSTIGLIGNENYSNIVQPDELMEKIKTGEPVTAYFFSPECPYCMKMTPIMMPIAKEKGIHVYQYNMLEFDKEAAPYGITAWPALIQYEDGKEVGRIVGLPEGDEEDVEQAIKDFFKEHAGK